MVWIVHSAVILQELPSFLLQIVYLADKHLTIIRDVVLTAKVWERTQKIVILKQLQTIS